MCIRDSGTTEQPTLVTVLEGSAAIEGPGVSLTVAANQTATLTGAGPSFQGSTGAAERDAFLAARLTAERPPAHAAPLPPQLAYMPGATDLAGVGEWSQAPDYGQVWYPPVSPSWVPYQDGNWAYVAPWGWTWVDAEPWGFAPFHYGRWAHIGPRWGWIPGDAPASYRPVYAPALVAFVGLGVGAAVGAALAHGSIGWVPLGPHEAYHPWYHASEGYLRQVNTGHVKDAAAINKGVEINGLVNRSAATMVPASVMMSSRRVLGAGRPIPAQAFSSARPLEGEQPLRPAATTFGVTPAVAHQLNLSGPGPRRPAPGPVVRAQAEAPANGQPPRPELLGPHCLLYTSNLATSHNHAINFRSEGSHIDEIRRDPSLGVTTSWQGKSASMDTIYEMENNGFSGVKWIRVTETKKRWFRKRKVNRGVQAETAKLTEGPVSYTHLDVYKRQRLFPFSHQASIL